MWNIVETNVQSCIYLFSILYAKWIASYKANTHASIIIIKQKTCLVDKNNSSNFNIKMLH